MQIFYPVIMILCLFWLIGIDTSSQNFWILNAYGLIGNFVFCGQGFFWGLAVPDENNVKLFNLITIMFFVGTNGALTNLNSANWFIKFMSDISPARFSCEGFFRCCIKQIPPILVNIDFAKPPIHVDLTQEAVLAANGMEFGD